MANTSSPIQRMQATRKDVARYAGVSTAVVSYVVNEVPNKVAPRTKEKVQEAISVLGYRPNAAARALKLGSTEMIGLVVPESSNPYFAELAHEIEEVVDGLGYAMLLTNSGGVLEKERRHVRNFASRQVDGVLLSSNLEHPDLSELDAAGIPVVLLGQGHPLPGRATVGVDFAEGARIGVSHLVEHGHQIIGLIMGIDLNGRYDEREVGWLSALQDAGLDEGPIVRSAFTREGGYQAGARMISMANRPTAIFVSSDMQAIGVLRALHEARLSVPEDIAVVSFDGSSESEFSTPGLTTVKQPVQEMAAAAVKALLDKDGKREHQQFPTELVIRRSCGCTP